MKTMKLSLAAALLILLSCAASAQKGNIGFIYPAGAQRGTTVELTIGGQGITKARSVLISGNGISAEVLPQPAANGRKKKRKNADIGEEDNLQISDIVKVRLTIAPDAAIGMRDFRLRLPGGVTNRLYFEVGQLPDVLENGKASLSAYSATLPVTFNGQIMRSDVDRFRFRAVKGQDLVIRLKGRVLIPYMADAVPGWFQPVMRLYGPDGREVAFNDDYTFHVDPVIFFKVPETGEYDIEVNDALYRGRGDFVYRIDVGELPFITSISPLGGKVGRKTTVRLRGHNLKSNAVVIRPGKAGNCSISSVGRDGIVSNSLLFRADGSSDEEVFEGVFTEPMQMHWYDFYADKKQQYTFSIYARRLGAPTDARITIYDDSGNVVKDIDDSEDPEDCMATHFADPFVTLRLDRGDYRVRVVESQGRSGEEYAFRLSINRAEPDFALNIEPPIVSVPSGGTGVFNVLLTRKQKFNGAVDMKVKGLPAGFEVAGCNIPKGSKKTIISVTAPSGADTCVLNPEVTGYASSKDGGLIVRRGVPVESMMQAFYYTHLMPMEEFRMEVVPEQPLKVKVESVEGNVIKVRLERKPGFNSPVTIMLKSSVPQVKAEAVVVPGGESEARLEVFRKIPKDPKKAKKQSVKKNVMISVYGVVKGTSKKIAGKGRAAYSAAVTAYAPVFEMEI